MEIDRDTPMPLQTELILPSGASKKQSCYRQVNLNARPLRYSSRLAAKTAQVSTSTLPTLPKSPALPVQFPPIQILKKPGAQKFQLMMKELPKDVAGLLVRTSSAPHSITDPKFS
jgi:hypothetical protein